jgi:transposase-like protein
VSNDNVVQLVQPGTFEDQLTEWPRTRKQRCWVHKTANVLAKPPKSRTPKAKRELQEIWMAKTKAASPRSTPSSKLRAVYSSITDFSASCSDKMARCGKSPSGNGGSITSIACYWSRMRVRRNAVKAAAFRLGVAGSAQGDRHMRVTR